MGAGRAGHEEEIRTELKFTGWTCHGGGRPVWLGTELKVEVGEQVREAIKGHMTPV